jgi:MoaA/NifB/PqqE/SkfB family radical SAM enzyme
MNNWQRLLWYYGAGRLFTPRPRWFCYNVTRRCDSRCIHCGIWRGEHPEELPPEELRLIFSNPFFGAVRTAWLTGGEPTLRQDLAAVAAVMIASMPSLTTLGLATHGIRTQRVIQQVVNLLDVLDPARHGLFIHLSLDSAGEVHDQVRGIPGAQAGVLATLDAISELRHDYPGHRIEAGLNCVIQPANVAELPRLLAFARERGLSITFNIVVITDQIFDNLESEAELRFLPEQVEPVANFLEQVAVQSSAALGDHYRQIARMLRGEHRDRRCLTLWSTVNLEPDGTFLPCPTCSNIFPVNVKGRDLEELWRSQEMEALRRRIVTEHCPTCRLGCSLGDSLTFSEWRKGGWGP